MVRKVLISIFFMCILVATIAFARGYRIDVTNVGIESNGMISITSSPKSAKVYVNDQLKGITDLNLYLEPGEYTIKIVKEGYFPWVKRLKVQGEVVQSLDATIYPINSSLSPLTNIGIVKAIAYGTGEKKVLILSSNQSMDTNENLVSPIPSPATEDLEISPKAGVYLYDPRNHAVSLFPSLSFILDYNMISLDTNPEEISVLFSPKYDQAVLFYKASYEDNKQMMESQFDEQFQIPDLFETAYLINLDQANTIPLDVTDSVQSLTEIWKSQKNLETRAALNGYKTEVRSFLLNYNKIVDISLDKTRILYEATEEASLKSILSKPLIGSNQTPEKRSTEIGGVYLYDTKEDRNYQILAPSELMTQHAYPMLHPNSKNILMNDQKSVSIADFDGLNKQKVYSGPYESNFFLVTNDGRILILTNLNPALNTHPDLYAIGLR